jgi:kynurenine formamidase
VPLGHRFLGTRSAAEILDLLAQSVAVNTLPRTSTRAFGRWGRIPIMEIVNLEELAAEKIYEYVFFGACIKLRGATGAPMRPVAMPIRR